MADEREVVGALRFLCLEDVPADAELMCELLNDAGFISEMSVASNRQDYVELLERGGWDLILADYTLPDFDATAALDMAKERCPDTPFICVSGTIGEDRAVELLKQGATDYVLKDRMSRLAFAVLRALESARRQRERRASDDFNRLLVENMTDVLWVMDAETHEFTYVSPSIERLRGYTPEEVMATSLDASLTPEQIEWAHEVVRKRIEAFLAGDPAAVVTTYEIEQPCKDGSIVPTEVTSTIRHNDRGGLDIIGVTRDISERRRAEAEVAQYRAHLEELVEERTEELRQANTRLEEASRAKSDFLAFMSHELRTPLGSIIGFSHVMLTGLTGDLNEEQLRQIGMINASAERLLQLVNDILELSRVEAGGMEAVAALFDARAVVEDIAANVAVQAEERGLVLKTDTPGSPFSLTSDERLFRQIVLNLVGNAIKFTDEGEVSIELSESDDSAVVIVRDTGRGIAPEHLRDIFDEFWQARAAEAPGAGGTGLGLPISARMAVLLGGSLTVESTVGSGSAFTLRIPKALRA